MKKEKMSKADVKKCIVFHKGRIEDLYRRHEAKPWFIKAVSRVDREALKTEHHLMSMWVQQLEEYK